MPRWRAAGLTGLALASVLGGCTNIDLDHDAGWFSKPYDPLGRARGFSFYEFRDTQKQRQLTPADLVDPSGACPPPAMSAAAPAAPGSDGRFGATPVQSESGLLGQGLGLGMSECDVVHRAGAASAVDVRNPPGGERMVILTFKSGPWPGVYHFRGGRLTEMERGVVPAPEEPRKKPAKPAKKTNQA